jgi:hypothetical protein
MIISRHLACLLLLLAPFRVPQQDTQPSAAKIDLLPVPDLARQRDAEKSIKDTFKAEYAKRSPQDMQALGRKLLDLGKEHQDDQAVRFVFLREARDLSTQCWDLETALAAVSLMGQGFQIDPFVAKSAVLAKFSQSARTPEASAALARAYHGFLDEAITAGQIDVATGAMSKSEAAAKASADAGLVFRALALSKDVAYVQKEAGAVKIPRKTLEEKPEDPAANLAVGRFLCFALGDWDKGLPLLSKGGDADLKALALKDFAQPTDVASMTALGDAWWDLYEKEQNPTVKRRLRSRSSLWYRQALPGTTGLVRMRVENRLREPGTWNKPAGTATRTATVGASGDGNFEDLSRDNQPLVGFKVIPFQVGNGMLIRCLQPIFADGSTRVDGHTHGTPEGGFQEILAKPGYAVAGIVGKRSTRVDGFKVIFMRVAGPLLDPRDSYTSKWIGGTVPGEEVTLGGDGAYVVGIFGRYGADVDCFGLVQIK